MHDNLYFETVKSVLDTAIQAYSERTGLSISDIDTEISAHIEATSQQHYNPAPNINYRNPLCRLGYLYTHVGANAALFESAMSCSTSLSSFVRSSAGKCLSLCTVGGGPGTELLGLAKYCLINRIVPSEIAFTVLDNVQEWDEIWLFLARASRELLRCHLGQCPVVSHGFHRMDVVDPQSYTNYGWLFGTVDIMVYNYLISENQVRLNEFEMALSEMIGKAKNGCFFVVIDRLERMTSFRRNVTNLFRRSGLQILDNVEIGGGMDDNESVFGDYPTRWGRRPRRWFRTKVARYPTVFSIIAQKL